MRAAWVVWAAVAVALLLLARGRGAGAMVHVGRASARQASKDAPGAIAFLDKFCFSKADSALGNLTFTLWPEDSTGAPELVFFDDEPDSFAAVYYNLGKLTCAEWLARAKAHEPVVAGITKEMLFHDAARPHFWFFAVVDCSGADVALRYNLTALNPGGHWQRQFSFDQQHVLGAFVGLFVATLVVALAHALAVALLLRADSYHPLVWLLSASLALELGYVFAGLLHYALYAGNGVGAPGFFKFGEVLDMAAQVAFITLLVLIAKGWAITKNHIDGKKWLAGLVAGFAATYFALWLWHNLHNATRSFFMYDTVPGVLILLLRVAALVWFLWSIRLSHLEETDPTKRTFYLVIAAVYFLWFVALPLIALVAIIVAPWWRFKVTIILYLILNFLGLASMTGLFWPSFAQKYFTIGHSDILIGSSSSPYETL